MKALNQKVERLQRDADNIRRQKEQDARKEWTLGKIVYCMPYGKGDSEYGNTLDMFYGIISQNPDCYIIECDKCDDCGAINQTVERVYGVNEKGKTDVDGKSVLLCDFCAGRGAKNSGSVEI